MSCSRATQRPLDKLFDDSGFGEARHQANLVYDYLRRHGSRRSHGLPLDETAYTTMLAIARKLESRWEPVD